MEDYLEGFEGNLYWIFSEIESLVAGQVLSQYNSNSGGIEIWPGVDLGYCGPEIFEEVIRTNLAKRSWKNLVRNALNLKGQMAADYLLENEAKFLQFPDFSELYWEYLGDFLATIARVYWNKLLKINPNIANVELEPFVRRAESHRSDLIDIDCQTVILFFYIRNPNLSKYTLKSLCKTSNLCSKINLANALANLSANSFRNTDIAIGFLLDKYLDLSDTVGDGGANNEDDVQKISDRLVSLGYLQEEFTIVEGQIDWTPLNDFISIIEAGSSHSFNGLVAPGSLPHIWLCSNNAPKLVSVESQHISNQSELICHWTKDVIKFLEKKERVRALRSFNQGNMFNVVNLGFHSFANFGMEFKIKLPSIDNLECTDCNNPNFDQDKMEEICKNLLKSEFIEGPKSLKLAHTGLNGAGLVCSSGTSSNLTVSLCLPNSHAPKQEAVKEIEYGIQQGGTSQENPNVSLDNDKLFDYYSNIIQSRTADVIDFEVMEEMHLLGIAGWLNHDFAINKKNEYNDSIIALWKDSNGQKVVKNYKATTSPGTFEKYYNKKGDAHLIDGRYAYKRGTHNGYNALVQGEEFTVWRDKNKDGIRENDSLVETGYFGINLHAGGTGSKVKNWSAGCQVIWGGREQESPFQTFMQDVELLVSENSNVYYTLVNSRDLPSIHNYYLGLGGEQ